MKHRDKQKLFEALRELGVSAEEAGRQLAAFIEALEHERRVLVVDDFGTGLTEACIRELKCDNERMKFGFDEGNHPDGWYRKFEKKSGRRNLKL